MTKITLKSNFYLWLLTGRNADFANANLNTSFSYAADETPVEVTNARSLLRLNETDSDFFVLGALASIYLSKPLLRDLPDDIPTLFHPGVLSLPTASSSVPLLPNDSFSWPSVDGARAGKTGATMVTITRVDASEVTITTNTGDSIRSSYQVLDESGYKRLKVADAHLFGITADFQVTGWSGSDSVVVTLAPTRYPFATFAEDIRESSELTRMMTAEGTLPAFASTSNAARKVGLASIAIIKRMLRQVNPEQFLFEVERGIAEGSAPPEFTTEYTGVWSSPAQSCDVNEAPTFNA